MRPSYALLVSAAVEIITILAKNIPIEQLKFSPAMKDGNSSKSAQTLLARRFRNIAFFGLEPEGE